MIKMIKCERINHISFYGTRVNFQRSFHVSNPLFKNHFFDTKTREVVNADYLEKKKTNGILDVTIYIPGFLKHKDDKAIDGFLNSHKKIMETEGYRWSGDIIGYIPIPIKIWTF